MPTVLHRGFRTLLSHTPIIGGYGALVLSPPLKWLRFPDDLVCVRLASGTRIFVYANDFVGKTVYFSGDFDPRVTRTLHRLLSAGETLVDIGANVGSVSFNCLDRLGPSGRIIAVEPQPCCYRALSETVRYNNLQNVEAHELALSDHSGTFALSVPDSAHLGSATLEPATDGSSSVRVQVRNGSEFLSSLAIRGEYVVKIDVEGHEGRVIAGLAPYFRSHAPKAVLFESNTDIFKNPAYNTLRAEGFEMFQIERSVLRLRIARLDETSRRPGATDFVAVRPDAAHLLN
jgi:FkbM family methyltransferase